MKKILLIDNYDSFTYNLKHLMEKNYNGKIVVKRNDKINEQFLKSSVFDGFVISPGPKTPSEAGWSNLIIDRYHEKKPILGVCLGMQCINEYFGGKTVRSKKPVHGKSDKINVLKRKILFKNVPDKFFGARYHSLICDVINKDLIITSDLKKIPMSVEHEKYNIMGVQFHPESFMSSHGDIIIKNFLKIL